MGVVTRSMESPTTEVVRRRRLVRALWSSDDRDAHNTAFVMGGIRTARYSQNPVLLWEHGRSAERGTLPIANATEFGPDRHKGKNVFVGTARFWDDAFSDSLFNRYAEGQLRGWSIHAFDIASRPPTREERAARPDWKDLERVYTDVDLVEVSAVSLPSNPHSLTLEVQRGLSTAKLTPAEVSRILSMVRGQLALAKDDVLAEIERLKAQYSRSRWESLVAGQEERRRRAESYAAERRRR
jgi:hypothetical protein